MLLVRCVRGGVHPEYTQLHLLIMTDLLHERNAIHVIPCDKIDGHQRRTVLDHIIEGYHVQVEYHHFTDGFTYQLDD